MKTQFLSNGLLTAVALMCAIGCAREPAVGAGNNGSVAAGEASGDSGSQSGLVFDYSQVSPSSPYAVLDWTHENSEYDENFSLLGGFTSQEAAAELNFYWYINWVPATDSASPVLSGPGMYSMSDLELSHLACDSKAPDGSFDLYAVVTSADWSDTDARAWTGQSNMLFWDWSVQWDISECENLPALPEPEEGDEAASEVTEEEGGEGTEEEGGEATEEEGGEGTEEEGGEGTEEEGGEATEEEGGEATEEEGGEATEEEGGEATEEEGGEGND